MAVRPEPGAAPVPVVLAYREGVASRRSFGVPVDIDLSGPVGYDLALVVDRDGDGVRGVAFHQPARLTPATVRRFVADFTTTAEAAALRPDSPLRQLGPVATTRHSPDRREATDG
jgi:hypothetical protein